MGYNSQNKFLRKVLSIFENKIAGTNDTNLKTIIVFFKKKFPNILSR